MWSTISSLIGIRSSSPLSQQLVAQIRALRDSNAKFYISASKHPRDPAYLQCAVLVAMIDMATWINENHDRVMETNIQPIEFDALLKSARAAIDRYTDAAPEPECHEVSYESTWYDEVDSTAEDEPPFPDDTFSSAGPTGDKYAWTLVHHSPTQDDLDEHDARACPLNASSCWICSELFQVRHHPRHANVDWDRYTGEPAKFSAMPGQHPAGPRGVESHNSDLSELDERCPITHPEMCWVCCLTHVVAGDPLMSISLD
jgi:hypothetical protein